MNLFSRTRLRAGVTGCAVVALFVLTSGAPTSFAAEQAPGSGRLSVDLDGSTIHHEQPGILMRDGGVCDPIRHMGC